MVSAPLPAATAHADIGSKARLRLWIRLLRASRLIEGVARERLKTQFNATLPRFDVMAALHRKPGGMLMSEISRFLMVRRAGPIYPQTGFPVACPVAQTPLYVRPPPPGSAVRVQVRHGANVASKR